jgi:hypothetical protein
LEASVGLLGLSWLIMVRSIARVPGASVISWFSRVSGVSRVRKVRRVSRLKLVQQADLTANEMSFSTSLFAVP